VEREAIEKRSKVAIHRLFLLLIQGIIDLVDTNPTFSAPAITVERVSGQEYVQLLGFATVPDDIAVLS
jgi:hypothetical protein